MTMITTDPNVLTLMNVFKVDKDNQNALIAALNQVTSEVMSQQPGFISANIHRSVDGTKVTNYAQWESREQFESAIKIPAAQDHFAKIKRLAQESEPTLYHVDSIYAK